MTESDSGITASLGGTVGSRVSRLVADATAYTRQKMGPHQASVAQKVLADFTNHVSDEIRASMSPLWTRIADAPTTPDYLRDLTHSLATKRGQAMAWIGGTTTSAAMGGGIMALVTNELQPTIGALIRTNPNMPLSPGDAAAAVQRGLWDQSPATGDAGQAGVNPERFNVLRALQSQAPTAGEIAEMVNRGHMSQSDGLAALRRAGYAEEYWAHWLALGRRIPPTVDLAAMWNRGIVDTATAHALAERDGTNRADMDRYLELGGEPPAIRDVILAWRRGIIGESDVDRAIRQGPIRFEWIPTVKALQWEPLPPTEVADAVNQGNMALDRARAVAAQSGITAEDFDTIVANAGLPPGLEVITEALNRGLVTDAEFDKAFLESRLKNRYVPLYRQLRWRVIPQETVRRLYRERIYTRDQAAERLAWNGFSPEDREALLLSEETGATDSTKELSKVEILSLYADRAIDATSATEFLALLGFGAGEIGWLLTLADVRRTRTYTAAVLARLRAGYVAYRMSEGDASSIMDSLRIPVDQRDETIALWDLERLAVTRGLTVAQVQAALKRGLIDASGATARLTEQGYSAQDADVLVSLARPATG